MQVRFQEARGFVCSGANVVYMLIPADIWVDGGSQVFGWGDSCQSLVVHHMYINFWVSFSSFWLGGRCIFMGERSCPSSSPIAVVWGLVVACLGPRWMVLLGDRLRCHAQKDRPVRWVVLGGHLCTKNRLGPRTDPSGTPALTYKWSPASCHPPQQPAVCPQGSFGSAGWLYHDLHSDVVYRMGDYGWPYQSLGKVQNNDVSLISMFHGLRVPWWTRAAVFYMIAFFENHAVWDTSCYLPRDGSWGCWRWCAQEAS